VRLSEQLRSRNAPVVAAAVLALVPRVWLALTEHSVFWPDEIYQSIEPAHRLAFGNGLISWEFRDGARSWLLPALLAVILKVISWFTSSSLVLVCAVKLVMVAAFIAGVVLAVRYAEELGGRAAAWLSGAFIVWFPPLLVFSHRATPEMTSAPLIMLAAYCLLPRVALPMQAGLAAGLAVAFRMQSAPVSIVLLAELIVRNQRQAAVEFAKGFAFVTILSGLLDWVTWGLPFNSTLAYMKFTLQGGASTFGVYPASYYARTLWTSVGPALVPIVLGFVLAIPRAPFAVAAVVAFVGSHALIPHKEYRFIGPVFLLALSLSAVGLERGLERLKAPRFTVAIVALLVLLGSARRAKALTNGDLGHYLDLPWAKDSVWHFQEEPTLLLAEAGKHADVCGVVTLGLRAGFTGGYSYLHRNVPLLYRHQLCEDDRAGNYLIARDGKDVPVEYKRIERRGTYTLYRRDGSCALPEDYDQMLEGADDMGLYRAPIRQPDRSELRISAGMSGAAFTKGWANGERLECRRVRWATGRSSEIVFDLEPWRGAYSLSFTAQPYWRALPQSTHVTLNGHGIGDFQLGEGWNGYQALVSPKFVNRGRNVLAFAFRNAARGTGGDPRELAALFDQVVLSPLVTSVRIDVGTNEGRNFLASGFSGDERSGDRTVAWNLGPRSRIDFTLGGEPAAHVLSVHALGYAPISPVKVNVSINGRPTGALVFPNTWSRQALALPTSYVQPGKNSIELEYEKTAKPRDVEHGSTDDRQLAVMFDTIELSPLDSGKAILLGRRSAHVHQLTGWSSDERLENQSVVWSDGDSSSVVFDDVDASSPLVLRVRAQAFEPALPVTVEVSLNHKPLGSFKPQASFDTYELPIPGHAGAGPLAIVEFRYDHTARPKDVFPNNRDERRLAVRFESIAIAPAGSSTSIPDDQKGGDESD